MAGFLVPSSRSSSEEPPASTVPPAPETPSAVGGSFAQDLQHARRALGSLLQRLRQIRRAPAPRVVTGGVSSEEVVGRLRAGLQKEHQYVLAPLLERLDAMATRVLRGETVPIPTIEEGLALVDRYLHELHDGHLHLLELAGVDPARGEPARLAFQQLASDYEHARVRWATVRVMLHGFEEKTPAAHAMFGLTLAQECRAELAWHEFEEAYVASSLAPMFPAKVVETWRVELDRARDEGRADRVRIEDWVGRTAAFALPVK